MEDIKRASSKDEANLKTINKQEKVKKKLLRSKKKTHMRPKAN